MYVLEEASLSQRTFSKESARGLRSPAAPAPALSAHHRPSPPPLSRPAHAPDCSLPALANRPSLPTQPFLRCRHSSRYKHTQARVWHQTQQETRSRTSPCQEQRTGSAFSLLRRKQKSQQGAQGWQMGGGVSGQSIATVTAPATHFLSLPAVYSPATKPFSIQDQTNPGMSPGSCANTGP